MDASTCRTSPLTQRAASPSLGMSSGGYSVCKMNPRPLPPNAPGNIHPSRGGMAFWGAIVLVGLFLVPAAAAQDLATTRANGSGGKVAAVGGIVAFHPDLPFFFAVVLHQRRVLPVSVVSR